MYRLIWRVPVIAIIIASASIANAAPPEFSQNYTATISEAAENGMVVIDTVSATDPESQPITYTLESSSTAFAIDSGTGVVTVNDTAAIDYEVNQSLEVTIVATDTDQDSSTVSLAVEITNVNDNAPKFNQTVYTYSADEGAEEGTVGQLLATDADGDDIIYSLFDTTKDDFIVDSSTGVITTNTFLDFETIPKYNFTVIASDGVNTDTAIVVINIIDSPDERPAVVPVQSEILIDLDASQTDVVLSKYSVTDDQASNLMSGIATLKFLFDGEATVSE